MQRRKHRRIAVSIPVKIYAGNEPAVPGDIEDISSGGAFIRCSKTLPVGEKIRVEIHFSGMQVLEARVTESDAPDLKPPTSANEQAVVKWSQSETSFGIEFTALNLVTQYYLNKLTEHIKSQEEKTRPRTA